MKPSHVNLDTTETLGAKLDRDRLTRRARRVTVIIAAFRQQADSQCAEAHARNRHIQRAITEFGAADP
jgi:hypothetical protein